MRAPASKSEVSVSRTSAPAKREAEGWSAPPQSAEPNSSGSKTPFSRRTALVGGGHLGLGDAGFGGLPGGARPRRRPAYSRSPGRSLMAAVRALSGLAARIEAREDWAAASTGNLQQGQDDGQIRKPFGLSRAEPFGSWLRNLSMDGKFHRGYLNGTNPGNITQSPSVGPPRDRSFLDTAPVVIVCCIIGGLDPASSTSTLRGHREFFSHEPASGHPGGWDHYRFPFYRPCCRPIPPGEKPGPGRFSAAWRTPAWPTTTTAPIT